MLIKFRQYYGDGFTDWITCYANEEAYLYLKAHNDRYQVRIVHC